MPINTLTWGVKQSFRGYVEAAGGQVTVGEGARRATDGAFVFDAASEPEAALARGPGGALAPGRAVFRGQVAFEAHGGMLKVFLADPAVEIGEDGTAMLTVAETPAGDRRASIARLDLAAAAPGEGGETVIPCVITLDGMYLLGDHYPPGTPLDPVRLG
jgi:hypothetical protein